MSTSNPLQCFLSSSRSFVRVANCCCTNFLNFSKSSRRFSYASFHWLSAGGAAAMGMWVGVEAGGTGDTDGGGWGDGVSRGGWKMGWNIKDKDSHTLHNTVILYTTNYKDLAYVYMWLGCSLRFWGCWSGFGSSCRLFCVSLRHWWFFQRKAVHNMYLVVWWLFWVLLVDEVCSLEPLVVACEPAKVYNLNYNPGVRIHMYMTMMTPTNSTFLCTWEH